MLKVGGEVYYTSKFITIIGAVIECYPAEEGDLYMIKDREGILHLMPESELKVMAARRMNDEKV